jgi:hypothetical protein
VQGTPRSSASVGFRRHSGGSLAANPVSRVTRFFVRTARIIRPPGRR